MPRHPSIRVVPPAVSRARPCDRVGAVDPREPGNGSRYLASGDARLRQVGKLLGLSAQGVRDVENVALCKLWLGMLEAFEAAGEIEPGSAAEYDWLRAAIANNVSLTTLDSIGAVACLTPEGRVVKRGHKAARRRSSEVPKRL